MLSDALLGKKTDAQFDRVFDTKVLGLRGLLDATREDPIAWMCLFSSVAARSGNAGQADYAMANEVLNKVAAAEARRRGDACRVVSIGWGPWEGGMVTPSLHKHFELRGVKLLPVAVGAAAFVAELSGRGDVDVVIGSNTDVSSGPAATQPRFDRGQILQSARCGLARERDGRFVSDLFPPIAIVGQGCVLPGTLTPEGLWSLVEGGRSAISRVPEELWRLAPSADREALARAIASDVGGYVSGFDEVFDAGGFLIAPEDLAGLDPVFLLTLHAAREALRSAGMEIGVPYERGTVVLGNLGYPTPGLVEFALEVWGEGPRTVDARNRFQSGLPPQLVARALGFRGGFAVDAACASSLYAIKLACDALHDGRVDIALAGGVNHADDLFLHLGFTALGALSPTGQSRPFHRRADGLVPAQGAAVVVLKRLDDAAAAEDVILGVIRGVGVSNDGRSRGLLVPSEEGQVRAMRAAYAQSGLVPSDISLVECHATGTAVGDATELRSLRTVFEGASDVPLGSLKSNLGHLITASGAAALIKVLGAMRAQIRPPTLHAEEPLDEIAGPLRLLMAAEPWPSDGSRRAAISNFGFGGNNAHLIIEEWVPFNRRGLTRPARGPREGADTEIAVVGQTVTAGGTASTAAFEAAFLQGQSTVAGDPPQSIAEPFEMDVGLLRFPPADLKDALSQQTLLLHAAQTLDDVIGKLPRDRTALLVGMQCDAEVARCSLPWRRPGATPSSEPPLTAALVIGCMPNMVANRLGHQLDLRAPSFTVSAEEASGTVALELAMRSLRAGEIDAALVGAVDLSCEPVARAAGALLPSGEGTVAGDAAVLLVLKRLADARRAGDPVLAVLTAPATDAGITLRVGFSPNPESATNLSPLFGHPHAASGLLHVAAAISACRQRALPGRAGRPQVPWLPRHAKRRARVERGRFGRHDHQHLSPIRRPQPSHRRRDGTTPGGVQRTQCQRPHACAHKARIQRRRDSATGRRRQQCRRAGGTSRSRGHAPCAAPSVRERVRTDPRRWHLLRGGSAGRRAGVRFYWAGGRLPSHGTRPRPRPPRTGRTGSPHVRARCARPPAGSTITWLRTRRRQQRSSGRHRTCASCTPN